MKACSCRQEHAPRRIVITGGPGAGKTAVLELARRSFCAHVHVLPEAASIVFGGGFPRLAADEARRAAQRAIFHVQHELEAALGGPDAAVMLCDRGTIDGAAYWIGADTLWGSVGSTLEAELARYHAVLHLRTPAGNNGYNHSNPLRIESAAEAAALDERIAIAWSRHPRRYEIAATHDFMAKAARALEVVQGELPDCCRACATAADPAGLAAR